ncbi:unnamed protein product [Protopolystoma xenopodis]|uniref:Uncharacterized protein n=1 Tax=Protopolystoma xenopodis TaxID=117903 RepID=A0A3S5CFF3_9PLAT|nr:unnamed protein product [Protopolystoma xenopodis]
MMDESSAHFHPKRYRRSLELRQPERGMKAKRLLFNAIQPSSSGEVGLRISSSCTFMRNESLPTIRKVDAPRAISRDNSAAKSFISIKVHDEEIQESTSPKEDIPLQLTCSHLMLLRRSI